MQARTRQPQRARTPRGEARPRDSNAACGVLSGATLPPTVSSDTGIP